MWSSSLPSFRMLARHPALRTMVLIASGGIALMLANVIYAKLLAPADFGQLVVLQAVTFVAMGLLPLGFDNLIVRKELRAPLRTVGMVLAIGLCLAPVLGWLGHAWFDTGPLFLVLVVCGGVAGAATRLFAAIEQSELRFARSQIISQAPFVLFLGSAVFHDLGGTPSWQSAGTALVGSFVIAAASGYLSAGSTARPSTEGQGMRVLWLRALALTGIYGSLLLLNQMERLIAGGLLGMTQVGALGLATTLIASPLRLLSAGVGYTLMPRLKHSESSAERRRLLWQEFALAMAVGVPGAIVLLVIIPPLVEFLYGDKYRITHDLFVALTVLGLVRLNSGVVSAAINVLGNTRTLHVFNLTGWIAAALAAAAAFALSGFGSTGIVVGVTLGWLVRILYAAGLIRKML
jgi:O-antigen/teichoic acid export membrane protein